MPPIKGKNKGSLTPPENTPENDIKAPTPIRPEPASRTDLDNPPSLPSRDTADRLSLKIEGGKFAVTALQDRTVDKARAAFQKTYSDPSFRKWAGIEHEAVKPGEGITPPVVGMLFDAVAMFEVNVFTAKYQLPKETVKKICEWDNKEHEYLDKNGAALANRYIPPEYLKHADIGIFCLTVIGMLKMKMDLMERLSKHEAEKIGRAKEPRQETPASKTE